MGKPKKIEKKPVGHPPMYDNPDDMKKKIDEYFTSCEGELIRDENGAIQYDKHGSPLYKTLPRYPTITGLAYALGFKSRQALINYQNKDEFNDTITRAKFKIEDGYNQALFAKETFNGARYSLSNNFNYREVNDINLGNIDGEPFKIEQVALSDIPSLISAAMEVIKKGK